MNVLLFTWSYELKTTDINDSLTSNEDDDAENHKTLTLEKISHYIMVVRNFCNKVGVRRMNTNHCQVGYVTYVCGTNLRIHWLRNIDIGK